MVRSSSETVSAEAVREATGREPDAWFVLLDAANATALGHTAIARWLVDEHDVDAWWAQSITVRYEQARGLRLPGQQADGSFTASVSKRLPGTLAAGYPHVVARFSAEYGAEPSSARSEGARPYARWSRDDGSVLVTVEVVGVGKLRVTAAHERIADGSAVTPAKEALRRILSELAH